MRNCNIRECKNGWVAEIETYGNVLSRCPEEDIRGPYVFKDWDEMMEFITDYFMEEEE